MIDINENKLVELVRYVRSSIGYTEGYLGLFQSTQVAQPLKLLLIKIKVMMFGLISLH